MKRLIHFFALFLFSAPVWAQNAASDSTSVASQASGSAGSGNFYMNILIGVFILATLILLAVAVVLLNTFKAISKELVTPTPYVAATPERRLEYAEWLALEKEKPGIMSKILGLRPMAEEKDITLEHEFDGISELDNPTPAWFMWLFYATIVFAGAYLLTYHVFDWGKLQEDEYVAEIQQADAAKKVYLAHAANLIDENTVKESADAAVVSAGAAVFQTNCVACHGDNGQGVVGPNLTDEYWLHGGKINNVFKTIKYGIPEKGMISWEKTLTPKQISDVANFVKSLKGTNPPNPKAPQGEKEG